MMRLAEYLLRWTGDAKYADYRERNLYNGILAQQHPHTGMVTYFLPMRPGAKKDWMTRTESFFCCSGTLVQAHSMHGHGTYFEDEAGLVATGYVPAQLDWSWLGSPVKVTVGEGLPGPHPPAGRVDLSTPPVPGVGRPEATDLYLTVESERAVDFNLKLRLPTWLSGPAQITVDGEAVAVGEGPYVDVKRTWQGVVDVRVNFPRKITVSALPDRPEAVAFLDGPVVLAGLCDEERTLVVGDDPAAILEPDDERMWDTWNGGYHTVGQDRGVRFVPLYDVTDEQYTVYFPTRSAQ